MLALALPSVANAGMALALLCGIRPENSALLYLFATITTLAATRLSTVGNSTARIRELRLAGMFVGGQILTMLFGALSSNAHAHIAHLLNGDVLAAGTAETVIITAGSMGIVAAMFGMRKKLWSWCSDEDFFRTGARHYQPFVFAVYVVMAAALTIGVATVGALLITALMVLPALFGDLGRGGIGRFSVMVIVIGVTGALAGFLSSLALDLPPAVCAAAGVGVVGVSVKAFSASLLLMKGRT
jgi:zinc transport system permease protein